MPKENVKMHFRLMNLSFSREFILQKQQILKEWIYFIHILLVCQAINDGKPEGDCSFFVFWKCFRKMPRNYAPQSVHFAETCKSGVTPFFQTGAESMRFIE